MRLLEPQINVTVHLANARITIFYNALAIIFVFILVTNFWMMRHWSTEVDLGDRINFDIWHNISIPKLLTLYFSKLGTSVCTGAEFEYQWVGHSKFKYTNFSCVAPCISTKQENCISRSAAVREGDGQIFVASHWVITTFDPMDFTVQSHKNMFLPLEDAMDFQFAYTYSLPKAAVPTWDSFYTSVQFVGSSLTNTLTVFLDADGKTYAAVKPSTSGINLSLKKVFELSGKPSWLDQPQPELGRNTLANAKYM